MAGEVTASHRGHRGSTQAKTKTKTKTTSKNSSLISLFCEGEALKDKNAQKTTSVLYQHPNIPHLGPNIASNRSNANSNANSNVTSKVNNKSSAKNKSISNANTNSNNTVNSARRRRNRDGSLNLLPEIDGVRGIGVSKNGEQDATPRELYAIGAVFDHLYRGGSAMDVIGVFRKEVSRPRGNYGCGLGAFVNAGGGSYYGCTGGDAYGCGDEGEEDTYAGYTYNDEDDTCQTDTYMHMLQKMMDDETLPTVGDASLETNEQDQDRAAGMMYDLYTLAEDDPSLTSRESNASGRPVSPPTSPSLQPSSRRNRGGILRKAASPKRRRTFARRKSKTKSKSKDRRSQNQNQHQHQHQNHRDENAKANENENQNERVEDTDADTAALMWHGFSDCTPPASPLSFSRSSNSNNDISNTPSPPRVRSILDEANGGASPIYVYDDNDISEAEEAIERLRMWSEVLLAAAKENGPKVAAAALEGARAATAAATKAGVTAVPQSYRTEHSYSFSPCSSPGNSPPRSNSRSRSRPHASSAEATEDLTKLVHMMRDTVAENIPEDAKASTTALQEAVLQTFHTNLSAFLRAYEDQQDGGALLAEHEEGEEDDDDDDDEIPMKRMGRSQPLNSLAMRMQDMAYKEPTRTYAVSEENQVSPEQRIRIDNKNENLTPPPASPTSSSDDDDDQSSVTVEIPPKALAATATATATPPYDDDDDASVSSNASSSGSSVTDASGCGCAPALALALPPEAPGFHRGDTVCVPLGTVPTTIRVNSLTTVLSSSSKEPSVPRASSTTSIRRKRSLFRRKHGTADGALPPPVPDTTSSSSVCATPRRKDLLPPVPPPRSSTTPSSRKQYASPPPNSICSIAASASASDHSSLNNQSDCDADTDQATVATPPKMTRSLSSNGLVKKFSSFRLKKGSSNHKRNTIDGGSPKGVADFAYASSDGVVGAAAVAATDTTDFYYHHDGSVIDIDNESNVGNIEQHNLLSRFNGAGNFSAAATTTTTDGWRAMLNNMAPSIPGSPKNNESATTESATAPESASDNEGPLEQHNLLSRFNEAANFSTDGWLGMLNNIAPSIPSSPKNESVPVSPTVPAPVSAPVSVPKSAPNNEEPILLGFEVRNIEVQSIEWMIAVENGRILKQGDHCKIAFCQPTLPDDEITSCLPPKGCPIKPDSVRSAESFCKEMDFTATIRDPCVFHCTPFKDEPPIYIGMYVNDFVSFSKSDEVEKWFEQSLAAEIKISFMGAASWFLGFS
eukprot:jgi/Psemu1/27247/gm1.27247_g